MPTNNDFVLPEILATVVYEKLGDAIKLYPLAKVESLQGKAGESITVPTMAYIGNAEDVEAGANITLANFTQESETLLIKKAGKGMTFTEEDLVNHYLDIQAEAEKQLTKSIANKIEADMFGVLAGATPVSIDALNIDGLADAVVPFGEDLEEQMYLFVHPADLATLRKDDNFIVNANHGDGEVKSAGQIFGMEVVVTNRVTAGAPYIIKDGAVALYMRKAVDIELDKNIVNQTHIVVGTVHYVVALNDATKAIAVTVGAGA